MSVQNAFETNIPIALPGELADVSPSSKQSYVALTNIPFGRLVTQDVGVDPDDGARVPNATAQFPLGISIRVLDRIGLDPSGFGQYEATEIASVIRSGRIFVIAEDTTEIGGQVFFTRTGSVNDLGKLFATGDASRDGLSTNQYQWDSTTAAGQIGIVRIT